MTLLLNSATAHCLLGINKGESKAHTPILVQEENVIVTCQLLMCPNERVGEARTEPMQSLILCPTQKNRLSIGVFSFYCEERVDFQWDSSNNMSLTLLWKSVKLIMCKSCCTANMETFPLRVWMWQVILSYKTCPPPHALLLCQHGIFW